MTTPTEIELPCGVVLTEGRPRCFTAILGRLNVGLYIQQVGPDRDETWCEVGNAQLRNTAREKCIEWIDARLVETRAALAPKDALLPGDADRERLLVEAKVLGMAEERAAWCRALDFISGMPWSPAEKWLKLFSWNDERRAREKLPNAAVSQALAKGEGK